MPIFFVQYEATPLPESPEAENCGGAYVNCWVDAKSEQEASELTAAGMREGGWHIVSVEEPCRQVTDRTYADDDDSREYYNQAKVDGECYVFHLWSLDDNEDSSKH